MVQLGYVSVPSYPDDKLILGCYSCYLGPATEGISMTMKILKQNGQVVYRSTVRHLRTSLSAKFAQLGQVKWYLVDKLEWHDWNIAEKGWMIRSP